MVGTAAFFARAGENFSGKRCGFAPPERQAVGRRCFVTSFLSMTGAEKCRPGHFPLVILSISLPCHPERSEGSSTPDCPAPEKLWPTAAPQGRRAKPFEKGRSRLKLEEDVSWAPLGPAQQDRDGGCLFYHPQNMVWPKKAGKKLDIFIDIPGKLVL